MGSCCGECLSPGICCDGGCCGDGGYCPPGNKLYASAEYLLWFIRGSPLPPLVTQGTLGDPIPGALGAAGTTVLFGDNNVNGDSRSGARFRLGYWFGDQHLLGIEGGGFFLGTQKQQFAASSIGSPILARPIINGLTGMEDTERVADPGGLAGTVLVNTQSQLWGYDINLRTSLCCGCNWYVDLLAGYRALGLDESFGVIENLNVLTTQTIRGMVVPAGTTFRVLDRFSVTNRFYGGQVGFDSEWHLGRWAIGLNTKVAMGPTQQMATVFGNTSINDGPHMPGGLLALPSNIGHYSRDVFSVVPEVGVTLGYQLTDH
jgi:hypothetical protein